MAGQRLFWPDEWGKASRHLWDRERVACCHLGSGDLRFSHSPERHPATGNVVLVDAAL